MSEKKDKKVKETAVEEEKVETVETAPEENGGTNELEAKLAEAQEHILRIHAEFENYKKRTVREKGELYSAAAAEVITKLLPVFDNLERAGACTDFESLKQGVDMILASFHSCLESCGVKEVEALGKEFDPNLHNAVLQEEGTEYEPNTVCDVLQKGYILGERLVRPAMVKVAQ
ncbi:MAG: nucleotide exchange factor GrpE [Clostridia bacterium]|nr:nucleotide exchange factor GrpE [Clostridia bacterium]